MSDLVDYPSTPWRYLYWLTRSQAGRVARGTVLGTAWMVMLPVPPLMLAFAVDDGLRRGSMGRVVLWAVLILVTGIAIAAVAILRHRTMTRIRTEAALQTIDAAIAQSVRLGASLTKRTTAGEVVAVGVGDAWIIGRSLTITGPGVGAVLGYAVIAVLLMRISVVLALIIVVGLPILLLALGPLLGRVRIRVSDYRDAQELLSTRMVDIVSGLRVLDSLGGKSLFGERFVGESLTVERTGTRLARSESLVQAIAIGLPALFLASVVWIAAHLSAEGALTVGDLVAVYGYLIVAVVPISSFIESAKDLNQALVAAGRVVDFLGHSPDQRGRVTPTDTAFVLEDPESNLRVKSGEFAVVAGGDRGAISAAIDRLGGVVASDATWNGRRLMEFDRHALRSRVVVLDDDAFLFQGSAREVVSSGRTVDRARLDAVASASGFDEVLRGLTGGWDAEILSRGANLSGGQCQRLRLAQALALEPEVLIALDPLSAVDAITEAQVAQRVRESRRGSTSVIATTSIAVLGLADIVHFVEGSRVVASGSHVDLMRQESRYRRLVSRDSGDDSSDAAAYEVRA
ncbi:ABC transporter transmembrane domain-containing protein [Actinopolymorpha alba]|uniref:ABC transporter transmembrane domain-containing protein n=1 Tax=Actinopolymorpha alba TaxID=533267 RepID=UPI00146A4FE8|nr:ABC transporter ATP-binding protein [Actinopolymorpha alba]